MVLKDQKHLIGCCFWWDALNQLETVTNKGSARKTAPCLIDSFPPPRGATLAVLASCTLSIHRHTQHFFQVLPPACQLWRFTCNISWIPPPCVLPPLLTTSSRHSVERGAEEEEDVSDKTPAARWSLIPRHPLLLFSVNVQHDILFISSAVTSAPLWLNPSVTVSAAEACSGQVSNGYGPLKMHGGAIQSLTTEGNVKPLHCPPLTGVV